MKTKRRALRRHHMERIKARVAKLYGGYAKGDARFTGILAQTRVPCSCWGCHGHGPSDKCIQDKRFLDSLKTDVPITSQ